MSTAGAAANLPDLAAMTIQNFQTSVWIAAGNSCQLPRNCQHVELLWIHKHGGIEVLRPPDAYEREALLGLPPAASTAEGMQQAWRTIKMDWASLDATGNSWCLPAVRPFFERLLAIIEGKAFLRKVRLPRSLCEATRFSVDAQRDQPLPQLWTKDSRCEEYEMCSGSLWSPILIRIFI